MYVYYALDYLKCATALPLTGSACQHAVCWLKRQFENKEENSHTIHWLKHSYNQSLKFNISMIVIHSSGLYINISQPFQSPSWISSPPLFPTHHRTQKLLCSILCKHKNGQVSRDLLLQGFQHHSFYYRSNQLILNLLQLCIAQQGLVFSRHQHQTILYQWPTCQTTLLEQTQFSVLCCTGWHLQQTS